MTSRFARRLLLWGLAPLAIADNGVNTPWYLLFALLWAVLWRPRTRAGMAGAAVIGFITMMTTRRTGAMISATRSA